MKIEVLTGPQGGGKSRHMRRQAISQPGRYLFALPTIELIDEQVEAFGAEAPQLSVVPVHSRAKKGSTAKALSEAQRKFDDVEHAVILTTHETLMAHPLIGFDGWHGRIDEAPNAVQAGQIQISPTARAWLEQTFALETRSDREWSYLTLIDAKPNWKAVANDPGAKLFAEIIKIAGIASNFQTRGWKRPSVQTPTSI